MTPVVNFMVALHKIERAKLKARDILLLWTIKTNPGVMGQEAGKNIGFQNHSSIQSATVRLRLHGYMQDRRPIVEVTRLTRTPNRLYITPKGEALLEDIIPNG
jgi:hypothetical protein